MQVQQTACVSRIRHPCKLDCIPLRKRALCSDLAQPWHGHNARKFRGLVGYHPISAVNLETPLRVTNSDDAPTQAFNWRKHWYPVAVVVHLEPHRPHKFTLLGEDLVIWRDGAGKWQAFVDRCPHRLAPLSEGRIEPDGTLSCSYHGWRFNSNGACTTIPQVVGPAAVTACKSSRSCAAAHPCTEGSGLLWVWGESGTAAVAAAAAAPEPPQPPEWGAEGWSMPADWFWRDVPYGMDTLMENLFDPCHVPFTHHGIMGNARREDALPLDISTVQAPSLAGFQLFRNSLPMKTSSAATVVSDWLAPTCNRTVQKNVGGSTAILQFYGTPTRPGECRVFTGFFLNRKLPAIARWLLPLFEWNLHLINLQILDSDNYILHVQERILASGGSAAINWRRDFYLPSSADNGVVAFRRWFHDVAGPIPWANGLNGKLGEVWPRDKTMDRYSQHVQQCNHCKRALAFARVAKWLCGAAALIMTATALARHVVVSSTAGAPAAANPLAAAGVAAGCAVLATAAWAARELERRFFVVDYVHAYRN